MAEQQHPSPEQEPAAAAVATEERPADAPETPAAAEQPPQGPVPPPVWGAGQQRSPKPIGPFGQFLRNRLTHIGAALLVGALIGGGTVAIIDNHNNTGTGNVQPGNQFGGSGNGNGYGQFPGGGGFGNGNGFGNSQQGNGQQGNGFGSSSGSGSGQGGQGTGT